jgi:hypothetical protein
MIRKGGGIVSLRVLVGIVLLLSLLLVGSIIVNYGGDTAKTVMDEILGLRDIVPSVGEDPASGDTGDGEDDGSDSDSSTADPSSSSSVGDGEDDGTNVGTGSGTGGSGDSGGEEDVTDICESNDDTDDSNSMQVQLDELEGSGSSNDPYIVNECEQLFGINNDLNAHYVLGRDIDCTGVTFEPLADASVDVDEDESFQGVFDGQGYEISNLNIEQPDGRYVGLFSGVKSDGDAAVRNLRVTDASIVGQQEVGGVVGRLGDTDSDEDPEVSQVSFEGEIQGCTVVGGVVGWNFGVIQETFSDGRIAGNGSVGGITGRNFPDGVFSSYSTAAVTGDESVGGIVGIHYGTNVYISETYFAGGVSGNTDTGCIVGQTKGGGDTTITQSYYLENAGCTAGDVGEQLSSEELTGSAAGENMAFDFENTWSAESDRTPYLNSLE